MSDTDIQALIPGTIIRGSDRNYTIIKVLGKGGFGITYLVTSQVSVGNISVNVKFALKEHFISSLSSRNSNSQSVNSSEPVLNQVSRSMKSFMREAVRLHELGISHDNIVKVNEVFEANNTAYYVMEFIEGDTLKDYIVAHGPLNPVDAIELLGPIIEAVGMLHNNQVAHYDIKPQNIMLTPEPDNQSLRPVLIDFGLAKHYNEEGDATSTLGNMGYSEGYAPVEQYGGIKKFSPESDVYSLGATLYYCLTGKTPASATQIDLDEISRELRPIAGISLTKALLRAMEMKVQKRTPNASALLADLKASYKEDCTSPKEAVENTVLISNSSSGTEKTEIFIPQSTSRKINSSDTVDDEDFDEEDSGSKKWWILLFLIVCFGLAYYLTDGFRSKREKQGIQIESTLTEPVAIPDSNLATTQLQYISSNPINFKEENNASKQPKSNTKTDFSNQSTLVSIDNGVEINDGEQSAVPQNGHSLGEDEREAATETEEDIDQIDQNKIFDAVEQMPVFPGGEAELMKYLSTHIHYPPLAAENGIQGKVIVQFIVKTNGSIGDVVVIRSVDPDLDREAVRVVRSLPNFIPGRMNDQPVNVWYTLPINFKLQQ